jgi:hypothetical protein
MASQPPMVGSWLVRVAAVRPFTIHGDYYYELHAERPEFPGETLAFRVPRHAIAAAPKLGQVLELTFLMGQVTSARDVSA